MNGATGTLEDPIAPRFCRALEVSSYGAIDFSTTGEAIVAVEADSAYLALIAADPECIRLATPNNIDRALTTTAAAAARTFIEQRGIPADWINAGDTRREVIRGLAGMFLISRRMEGRYGEDFKRRAVSRGVNFETRWAALPPTFQTELIETAISAGWNPSDISLVNNPPLRAILRRLAERYESQPIQLGSVEI